MDILDLHRSGLSQRAIARKLGISRNTVKKYIQRPETCMEASGKTLRTSVIDPYTPMIEAWLEEDEYYTATWIYDRLVNQGYTGSYEIVKRKVRKNKTNRQKIAYARFETMPGHQAQVEKVIIYVVFCVMLYSWLLGY